MAKPKPLMRGPNPPSGTPRPKGVPTRERHIPGMYERPGPPRVGGYTPNKNGTGGTWSTPSGAVYATSESEDGPLKPVLSNRKKRAPLK